MWNRDVSFEGLTLTITNSMAKGRLSMVIDFDNSDLIEAVKNGDDRLSRLFDELLRMENEYRLIQDILGLGLEEGIKYFFNPRSNDIDKSLGRIEMVLGSPYCPDDLKTALEDMRRQLYQEKQQRKLKAERKKSLKKRSLKGDVYLIEALIGDERSYKIGWAKDAKRRSNLFEVKLPFDFELIHVFPADDARQAESALHKKFEHCRVNGEWFSLIQDDVSKIQKIDKYVDKEFLWGQAGR